MLLFWAERFPRPGIGAGSVSRQSTGCTPAADPAGAASRPRGTGTPPRPAPVRGSPFFTPAAAAAWQRHSRASWPRITVTGSSSEDTASAGNREPSCCSRATTRSQRGSDPESSLGEYAATSPSVRRQAESRAAATASRRASSALLGAAVAAAPRGALGATRKAAGRGSLSEG